MTFFDAERIEKSIFKVGSERERETERQTNIDRERKRKSERLHDSQCFFSDVNARKYSCQA